MRLGIGLVASLLAFLSMGLAHLKAQDASPEATPSTTISTGATPEVLDPTSARSNLARSRTSSNSCQRRPLIMPLPKHRPLSWKPRSCCHRAVPRTQTPSTG